MYQRQKPKSPRKAAKIPKPNFKFDFLAGLRQVIRRQELPEDVFPELGAETGLRKGER